MTNKAKILIVDDEKPTRDVMARVLAPAYECLTASDAEAALKLVAATPDLALILTDYKMPGDDGVTLIRKAKAANGALAAILITAFGEIELAVAAMKDGADDFLTKPITDLGELEQRVAKAIERHALIKKSAALEAKVEALQSQINPHEGLESFTGKSPAMEAVYRLIRRAAKANASVLVEGPSGTGKELVARALHDLSPRRDGPFVAVECAALPATLLESELFGSVKGAYTDAVDRAGCFETADGGTIFLDEIGEIDPAVQVKLLRVLETHTFQRVGETKNRKSDFRLVAATNRDLAARVREGAFREDLYYRLNVIDIHLPALKERPGDIALLASRFLKEYAKENGGAVTGIDAAAMKALEDYDWPGNVRQLRNVIEKMVVLSGGGKLTLDDVPLEIVRRDTSDDPRPAPSNAQLSTSPTLNSQLSTLNSPLPPPSSLADVEKSQILAALAAARNNKSKAAIALGISRRTLHRKLKDWGMS